MPGSGPSVIFINGLNRGGTTVTTAAVTEATGGVTTTVQTLARHIPSLRVSLPWLIEEAADRGMDRLKVEPDMVEEYAPLLHIKTNKFALYGDPRNVPVLRAHIDELSGGSPDTTVVLKNPWDTGQEARILADFPEAKILLIRRNLADVERSALRSMLRNTTEHPYLRAVRGDGAALNRIMDTVLGSAWLRAVAMKAVKEAMRHRVALLTRRSGRLPLDRVAFLSYDELRADPYRAAAWAGHILDPRALAEAFVHHAFSEHNSGAPMSRRVARLDRRWERAWQRARMAQVAAGVVPPPGDAG